MLDLVFVGNDRANGPTVTACLVKLCALLGCNWARKEVYISEDVETTKDMVATQWLKNSTLEVIATCKDNKFADFLLPVLQAATRHVKEIAPSTYFDLNTKIPTISATDRRSRCGNIEDVYFGTDEAGKYAYLTVYTRDDDINTKYTAVMEIKLYPNKTLMYLDRYACYIGDWYSVYTGLDIVLPEELEELVR